MAKNIRLEPELNKPSQAARNSRYYKYVPKDKAGQLKFRAKVVEKCAIDREFRNMIIQACREDICFFASMFVFLHETRPVPGQPIGAFPCILTDDQVDLLYWLAEFGGKKDIVWQKSRGIGASWLMCIYVMWLWLFQKGGIEIAMVSKTSDSLDLPGRPGSLMGKLDLIYRKLPLWMRTDEKGEDILNRTHTHHRFVNKKTNNSILGFEAVEEGLRGGRFFVVVLDEAAAFPRDFQRWLAAALGATFSIIWTSTLKGRANTFYQLATCTDPSVNIVRIEHWFWACPRLMKGAYQSTKGVIDILDKEYQYPPGYFEELGGLAHEFDGRIKSTYVDDYLSRPGVDKAMAEEELYGLVAAESRKLLDERILSKARMQIRRPEHIGKVGSDFKWVEDLDGEWKLWGSPFAFKDMYYLGCDPALGSVFGAFSAITVINGITGEVVLTATFEACDITEFARKVTNTCEFLAAGRGLSRIQICYESTGINVAFANELQRLRYPNLWNSGLKPTPGYHNRDGGIELILEAGRAVRDNELFVRDENIIEDWNDEELDRDKLNLVFVGKKGHGDLGISAGLAWWAAKERRRAIMKRDSYNRSVQDGGAYQESRGRRRIYSLTG